jgi:hypothetical protein
VDHCQEGMVGSINAADNETLLAYQSASEKASTVVVPAGAPTGGLLLPFSSCINVSGSCVSSQASSVTGFPGASATSNGPSSLTTTSSLAHPTSGGRRTQDGFQLIEAGLIGLALACFI